MNSFVVCLNFSLIYFIINRTEHFYHLKPLKFYIEIFSLFYSFTQNPSSSITKNDLSSSVYHKNHHCHSDSSHTKVQQVTCVPCWHKTYVWVLCQYLGNVSCRLQFLNLDLSRAVVLYCLVDQYSGFSFSL